MELLIFALVWPILPVFAELVNRVTPADIKQYFEENLSQGSEVYLPEDSGYATEITQRWNTLEPPTYLVAVKPATDTDVLEVVEYASNQSLPFLGTGGGHGYTITTSTLDNGIDIDLGFFNTIEIDASKGTMTIGGSVKFGDILDRLYEAGKEIQTGFCTCVGMVGATLGGGVGPFQGLHGLLIDSLVSVHIVTGTGEIVEASETVNSDLFWGVRGAGANFGIITSATYRVHDLTNGGQALVADYIFSASQNTTLFETIASLSQDLPDAFSFISVFQWSQDFEAPVIMISTLYYGPEDTGIELNQPFLELEPLVQDVRTLPWNRIIRDNRFGADEFGCIKGNKQAMYGLNLYTYDVPTVVDVFEDYAVMYQEQPDLRLGMYAFEFNPRRVVTETPDEATAYAFRETLVYTFEAFVLPDASLEPIAHNYASAARQKLAAGSGNLGLETYVNYAHGDEGQKAWYSEDKMGQLLQLKRRWDPDGFFNFSNGILGY